MGNYKACFLSSISFCYEIWRVQGHLKVQDKYDGMPKGSDTGDATQNLAIIRQQAAYNCKIIEQTAIEADGDIYQYILKAVTEDGVTFKYLKTVMNIPCGKDMFYDRRRKFYYLLSKKI